MDSAAHSTHVCRRNVGHWRRQWTQDCVATAFGHRRDTGVLWALIRCGVAVAWCAEGDAESGGQDRASAWQGVHTRGSRDGSGRVVPWLRRRRRWLAR